MGPEQRRCGILKSAIHRARVEGLEEKVLRAVAVAQRRTGLAITTHTTGLRRQEIAGGNATFEQWEILKAEGVPPHRLIVGHVDERPDIDALARMAQIGCFIQFDVIGQEQWLLDATRAELIAALIDRGYVNNLLMSHDRTRDVDMRYRGNAGYCHIFETFLPRLRTLGVTSAQIEQIMVHNPARALNVDEG